MSSAQPLSSMMLQRRSASDDGHRQSCDAGHNRRDPVRYPCRRRPRHADHRPPSENAPESSSCSKKPVDLHAVVDESLALVAHEMIARQIVVTINLPSNPCVVNGDQVLLQQVLVNLLMNAMDAMAETPPARRHVTISKRSQGRRCRSLRARHWTGFAGGYHRHAVHTIRHDEIAWPRDRPHDRADDRRCSRWHHRGPQQSRRGRDIHCHAAAAESAASGDAAAALARDRATFANNAGIDSRTWATGPGDKDSLGRCQRPHRSSGDRCGASAAVRRRAREQHRQCRRHRWTEGVRRLEGFESRRASHTSRRPNAIRCQRRDGVLSAFRGAQLEPVDKLDLEDDADNIRIDREQGTRLVGAGAAT